MDPARYTAGSTSAAAQGSGRNLVATLGLVVATLLAGCNAEDANKVVSIDAIRLTAAGHYVDLRYRVLDPKLANAALGPKVKPVLIDEASGREMEVPMTAKLGLLRQSNADQHPGRTYFILFANTAAVRPGSKVTAKLGSLELKHLTVE
ncbi:MAG: hypothetical protein R3E77_14560 [Steroidobacteraceae bacterium]